MKTDIEESLLTDLEAVAIGCVRSHEPCTAHFVRMQFQDSPSSRFSSSAGSVYPMMRRLEERGLLFARSRTEGHRTVSYYRTTRLGIDALRRWIGPPVDPRAATTTDPLRTQMTNLGALGRSEQRQWLDDAERLVRDHLDAIAHAAEAAAGDVYWELAHENARLINRARLRWLREARKRLDLVSD